MPGPYSTSCHRINELWYCAGGREIAAQQIGWLWSWTSARFSAVHNSTGQHKHISIAGHCSIKRSRGNIVEGGISVCYKEACPLAGGHRFPLVVKSSTLLCATKGIAANTFYCHTLENAVAMVFGWARNWQNWQITSTPTNKSAPFFPPGGVSWLSLCVKLGHPVRREIWAPTQMILTFHLF